MPNYENHHFKVVMNAFSAEIDHTRMTGGTLETRKIFELISQQRLHIHTVLFPVEADSSIPDLFAGIHTLEHGLAYKGGVRDGVVKLTDQSVPRESIVDISPFIHQDGRIGFRAVSILPLPEKTYQIAIEDALEGFADYLHDPSSEIPFANPVQCGQYGFHSREAALQIAQASHHKTETLEPYELDLHGRHVVVADLRLLKPQLPAQGGGSFLEPHASFEISRQLEQRFRQSWQTLYSNQAPEIVVGTYGCMTGDYLVIGLNDADFNPDSDKSGLEEQVHTAVIRSLKEIKTESPSESLVQTNLTFALPLIQLFSQERWEKA